MSPFNSPLETGVRSLAILSAAFPQAYDLQYLVFFDYLTVHSGDVDNGPESLHAPLPMRTGELAIRRSLIERGLFLMISRGLVDHLSSAEGFQYRASESADAFLAMMRSPYMLTLRECADWVIESFGSYSSDEIKAAERSFYQQLSTQFQPFESIREVDL